MKSAFIFKADLINLIFAKSLRNPQHIEPGESVSVKIKFIVGYDAVLSGFELLRMAEKFLTMK